MSTLLARIVPWFSGVPVRGRRLLPRLTVLLVLLSFAYWRRSHPLGVFAYQSGRLLLNSVAATTPASAAPTQLMNVRVDYLDSGNGGFWLEYTDASGGRHCSPKARLTDTQSAMTVMFTLVVSCAPGAAVGWPDLHLATDEITRPGYAVISEITGG